MARPGLLNHPKFRRLCFAIDVPVPHALGYLECLWSVAYETGNPVIGDAFDIELAAHWPGEKGALHAALLAAGGAGRAGFIEPVEGREQFQIHDLFDHAPEYVTNRRAREIERQRSRICKVCGGKFRSTEAHAKYCSHACRQKQYRETQRDEALRHGDVDVTQRDAPPAPAPAPNIPLPPPAGEDGNTKRAKKPKLDPARFEDHAPVGRMDTPAFRAAWREWFDHRTEINKPMTPRAARMTLSELTDVGPERAVAGIRNSIARGYQGIVYPDQRSGEAGRGPGQAYLRREE